MLSGSFSIARTMQATNPIGKASANHPPSQAKNRSFEKPAFE